MRVEAAHIPSHSDPVPRAESGHRTRTGHRTGDPPPPGMRQRPRGPGPARTDACVPAALRVGHNSVTRIYTEIRVTDTGTSRQGRSAF